MAATNNNDGTYSEELELDVHFGNSPIRVLMRMTSIFTEAIRCSECSESMPIVVGVVILQTFRNGIEVFMGSQTLAELRPLVLETAQNLPCYTCRQKALTT